ncbi:MAG: hypothetical protein JWL83_4782 [Actinomycetia bacterium]|nr:hypothetical protein [Actinomycetes bacterium]
MTATTMTVPTTRQATPSSTGRKIWRTGAMAGLGAAAATSAFAALADAVGVSLKVSGQAIPVLGFAQITFVAAMIGAALAVVLSRRAQDPMRTFVRTTLALTAISFVPDVLADAQTATRIALALSHVVAAAIVIPALTSRLTD